MGKGPNWDAEENATLLKAIADGASPMEAAVLLPGRNPKACQTHANALGHRFKRQPARPPPQAALRPQGPAPHQRGVGQA
jgi:hypothetical protein